MNEWCIRKSPLYITKPILLIWRLLLCSQVASCHAIYWRLLTQKSRVWQTIILLWKKDDSEYPTCFLFFLSWRWRCFNTSLYKMIKRKNPEIEEGIIPTTINIKYSSFSKEAILLISNVWRILDIENRENESRKSSWHASVPKLITENIKLKYDTQQACLWTLLNLFYWCRDHHLIPELPSAIYCILI